MKMKKIFTTTFLILCVSIITNAQTIVNGELKGLLEKSLTYFPKVKEVEASVQLAENKLKLTELNKYPDFTIDASYAYVRPKIEVPFGENTFQFAPIHNVSGAVNGTYALIDFGRLKASIEKSKLELQSAHHIAAQLQNTLFTQISQLYFQIIYAQKAIQIQDQIIGLLNENKKVVDAQLANGSAIQLDALTMQSKIDNENNRKIDLETNLKKLLNLLKYATGVETVKQGDLVLNIKNYTYDEALQFAIDHNPSLAIARDKTSIAKSDVAISKLADKPFIGAKASMGSKNGYLPTINDPKFNYNAGIGLSIPLFNGGKIKQLVKIQEKGLELSEINVASLVHETEKDIQAALIDINSSQNRIKNAATQIEQAALAQKLSATKLKNGTTTPLEITSTNADYQKALLNQLQYQFQLCNAQIELLKIMGVELVN
jgi:outer membrane protein TolC